MATNNPLTELIPAQYRKYVYGVATLLAAVYALWQVSGGDWEQFAASGIAALVAGLATSNTDTKADPGQHFDGHEG